MRLPALCLVFSTAAALAADFPAPFNSGNEKDATPPLSPEEAVKKIRLPAGFKATLFAGEPDVQNPIACAWDSRGRLWIAENYTYAETAKTFDHSLRDRIVIFEDTDNDGRHDKRTVFADNLKNLTSIELGYGGVYATAAPHLLFIPDKNRDDRPDGEPEVLLDGFDDWSVRHNFVNGLKWGPDGWLYGRHGIQATSRVGRPGAAEAERVKMNCGIWRFHPVRKTFEVVTWGGTNPWGHDWNAEGEGFFINTVIGHLYHIIPGAHYERMYGEDPNPHIYELLPQTADHYHFDTSKSWTDSRDGKANDLGGGHAHSGLMIYQGENWPEQYRGKVFTINLHGRRINVERLERKGSGYVAKHEPDFAHFDDPWFRGVELTYGPDGGVYVLDWSDRGECHENDGVHRTSGRIYKITYGEVKKPELGPQGDLTKWELKDIIREVVTGPEWNSRIARRVLADQLNQAASEEKFTNVMLSFVELKRSLHAERVGDDAGKTIFRESERIRLALTVTELNVHAPPESGAHHWWTILNLIDPGGSEFTLEETLRCLLAAHPGEFAQLIAWDKEAQRHQSEIASDLQRPEMARIFPGIGFSMQYPRNSNERRLATAVLGRYPPATRFLGIAKLLDESADRNDALLPSLIWSVAEPLAAMATSEQQFSLARIALNGKIPQIWRFTARRLAADIEHSPSKLDELLNLAQLRFENAKAKEITRGISEALRGRHKVSWPTHWAAFAAKAKKVPGLAHDIRALNVIFGDGRALDEIRALALDGKTNLPTRRQALETLITSKAPDLRAVCEKLIPNRDLAHVAIRGLATFDDEAAAKLAVAHWDKVRRDAQAAVIGDFATRPVFTRALLDAIAAGKIRREELTPYHARQIVALSDPEITAQLAKVWGEVRATPEGKKQRIAELKAALTPDILAKADIAKGREVFTQACAACHRLFDLGTEGTHLGPNLTGSGRQDLDYLLENIVDPNALVPQDYKLSVLTMKDGRTLSGFISAQAGQTITLRAMTDTQTVAAADIAKTESSPNSLMPEGLLDTLTPEQIRDLFGFLMTK